MSDLPDELWQKILEMGVQTARLTYKDLCSLSISSSRLRRLSDDDALWSLLFLSDFNPPPSSSLPASKSLYKLRFEKEGAKKIAAHRRAVLRKESQLAEHSRNIRDLEARLAHESDRARATVLELSNLSFVRQASAALNVWQPEVVRARHKQVVEQNVVPLESRVRALEMELRLCKQQASGFERAYKDEKQRLDAVKEELNSMKYHPLRPNVLMGSISDARETNFEAKKLKRYSKQRADMSFAWDEDLFVAAEVAAEGVTVAAPGVTPVDPASSSAPHDVSSVPPADVEDPPEVEVVFEEDAPEGAVGDASDLETVEDRVNKRRAGKQPASSRRSKRSAPSRARTISLTDEVVSSFPSPLRVLHEEVISGYDVQCWRRATRVDPMASARESVAQTGQHVISLLGSLSSIQAAFDESAAVAEALQEKTSRLEAAEKELTEVTGALERKTLELEEAKKELIAAEAESAKYKEDAQAVRGENEGLRERIVRLGQDCGALADEKAELLARVRSQEGFIDPAALTTLPAYTEGMRRARAVGRDQAGTMMVEMIKRRYPDLDLRFLYAPEG